MHILSSLAFSACGHKANEIVKGIYVYIALHGSFPEAFPLQRD